MYLAKHIGRYGKPIIVPKIRTMYPGAEDDLERIVKENGLSRDDKPNDDSRIIPSRRWLRKIFFDEIPQIPYNLILKRNFRLVGVRSKSTGYWENYHEQHKKRCLNSPYYAGFLGVHRYNPNRTGVQNERRYLAEHKVTNKKYLQRINSNGEKHISKNQINPNHFRSFLIDLKYAFVIIANILSGKTKGG